VSDETRYVRNRTDEAVFLAGHGSIAPGKDGVEVKSSDAVDAAIEARVLEETTKPAATSRAKTTTDKDKEGGQ
jgi:hypothetical protein